MATSALNSSIARKHTFPSFSKKLKRMATMNHRKIISITSALALVIAAGCNKSGGSFSSFSGNGFGSPGGGSSSSSSSNNLIFSSAQQQMPGNSGGYLEAGRQAFSGLKLGPRDEDAMGQGVAISVTSRYPIIDNDALNQYVALVGFTVADASSRPDGHFVFGVLDTPEVGAFSGPNGYVMITRGALMQMQDESELAGVLGHEIAHVCHHDGLHAVQHAKLSGAAAQAAQTAMENNQTAALFDSAVDSTTDVVLVKGYDKNQEIAADKDAVKYMTAAGYDPAGYEHFVNRMAAKNPRGNGGLFSTHPGFAQRSAAVTRAVDATGKSGTGATDAARFHDAVAGIS
jgi:predicted Zn-dependent protease